MKIHIDQIPESGLEIAESCEPSSLDIGREDIKFPEPVKLSGRIDRGINSLTIRLNIKTVMEISCNRCLEEVKLQFSKDVKWTIPIEDKKEIDILDDLREEIILSYPLKPLCREDCRGLCRICGQNLNKGKCSCKP